MYINGKEVESGSGKWMDVENPSKKGTFSGRVPRVDQNDVDMAVRTAHEAFQIWRKTPPRERGALLLKVAVELEKIKEEVAYTIASENGNAIRTQARGEANGAVDLFKYYTGLGTELKGTTYPGPNNLFLYSYREPVGVVAAIVPWNAPVQLTAGKLGAALIAGNTVILKVASDAPMAAMMVAKVAGKLLPPGVVNVLSGPGRDCGDVLVQHPLISKISLTGSTEVGKGVLKRAADRIVNSTMELGGKNPQIVFPDCIIDKTVAGILMGTRVTRQGQSCTSGANVYIHKDIFDEVVKKLCDTASKLKIGDACAEENDMGAITNKAQYEGIIEYIKKAMDEPDTKLLTGGLPPTEGPLSEGYFLLPTIFTSKGNSSVLVKEEVFGPVITCIPWETEEEVVALANETEYGLAAFVWSQDTAKAMRVAHEIQAGWTLVNCAGGQVAGQPYGGVKESGLGREYSLEGMLESFTELKSVIVSMDYTA
jgi:betaine-aldehyde dehydrogenase